MTLAEKLGEILRAKGITPYRLAELTGLTRQGIGHILAGKTNDPSWRTVVLIAKALGVSSDSLAAEVLLPETGPARGRGRPRRVQGAESTPP